MITISIDVTQIDKSKIKEVIRRNGDKAKFLELVLIEHKSEWGDFIVKQGASKEERAAGKKLPIIGNAKNLDKTKQPPF